MESVAKSSNCWCFQNISCHSPSYVFSNVLDGSQMVASLIDSIIYYLLPI